MKSFKLSFYRAYYKKSKIPEDDFELCVRKIILNYCERNGVDEKIGKEFSIKLQKESLTHTNEIMNEIEYVCW